MEYLAKHYVPIAGRMVTPGEIFSDKLPKAMEEWLLEAGAIERLKQIEETVDETPVEESEPEQIEEAYDTAPTIDVSEGIVKKAKKPRRTR